MTKSPKKLNRTLAGLREALFDELDSLRAGSTDHQHARATAELAKAVLDAASLQLQFEKAWHEKKIAEKLREVELVPQLEQSK